MLNREIAKRLNQQIEKEFQSSYLYLDISSYYKSLGLSVFASWFNVQFQREIEHARLFITYLLKHKEKVIFNNVKNVVRHYNNFIEPMKISFLTEQANELAINKIYNLAKEINDYDTVLFIASFRNKHLRDGRNFRK